MRKFFTFLTILIQHVIPVTSKISLFDISEILKEMSLDTESEKLVSSSILNPIFGYLFESTGALSNIRFYGPFLKNSNEDQIIDHTKDSSDDPIVNLLIKLFPSPNGVLSHISKDKESFGYNFSINYINGIEFLSEVFVKILKPNIMTKYNEEAECESFKAFRKVIFHAGNEEQNIFNADDEQLIKLMAIHAFIVNALDEKKDLKLFFLSIIEKIADRRIDTCDLDCDVTKEVLKIQKASFDFPFSELNQPPYSSIIPIYDRSTGKYDESVTFSDQVESLLLNICNCLFYDTENHMYSIGSLDPESDLAKFYKKNQFMFNATVDIKKEWSKVIQGHSNFPVIDKSKYKTHSIEYSNIKRNEVAIGIINMMNVLIKICNINHKKFWTNFESTTIDCKLKELFHLIAPTFVGQSLSIKPDIASFKEFNSKERTDFIGSFDMIIKQINGNEIKLKVTQNLQSAFLKVVSYVKKQRTSPVDFGFDPDFISLHARVFKNYIDLYYGCSCPIKTKFDFASIYFSGYIATNEQKRNALINIGNGLIKYTIDDDRPLNYQKADALKGIANSILKTVNLECDVVKSEFLPLLFCYDKFNEDVMECWIQSYNINQIEMYRLWEGRIISV